MGSTNLAIDSLPSIITSNFFKKFFHVAKLKTNPTQRRKEPNLTNNITSMHLWKAILRSTPNLQLTKYLRSSFNIPPLMMRRLILQYGSLIMLCIQFFWNLLFCETKNYVTWTILNTQSTNYIIFQLTWESIFLKQRSTYTFQPPWTTTNLIPVVQEDLKNI